ncbi:BA75_05186T0 [Komagataella pastoris]|uniref:BA75_05186T0 n=1 Tax=Komagataella pastoris TaxID=4922 RepID=A0A1B2JIN6_PICPA|nr:BA75_05186T0 [Komagataella pastoris]
MDFALIHLGAGKHNEKNRDHYRSLCFRALKRKKTKNTAGNVNPYNYIEKRQSFEELLSVMNNMAHVLESSPLTNTGRGASVNCEGKVLCDASIILLESKILHSSCCEITTPFPISVIIDNFKDQLNPRHDHILSPLATVYHKSSRPPLITNSNQDHDISDTIGISLLNNSISLTASSSGGNLFKPVGRIGPAGIIGSAIYSDYNDCYRVSIMCTGSGEDIISMDLARSVCNCLLANMTEHAFASELMSNHIEKCASKCHLRSEYGLYVGVVGWMLDAHSRELRVIYAHSTESLVFAYFDSHLKFYFSTNDKVGKLLHGEFKCSRL